MVLSSVLCTIEIKPSNIVRTSAVKSYCKEKKLEKLLS